MLTLQKISIIPTRVVDGTWKSSIFLLKSLQKGLDHYVIKAVSKRLLKGR